MTGLRILAGVLLVLLLLGLVRLGGGVIYSHAGLWVRLRVGIFRFTILSPERKEKPPKPKKKKPKKEPAEGKKKPPGGGALETVRTYLPLVCQAAGELKRKIRIDRLLLELTVGSANAAETAMAYGRANMALGMLWPLIEQNFEVKEARLHTGADFTLQGSVIYIDAAFSARLGQLVSFALRFGWKFLRTYLQNRPKAPQITQKEAIRHERASRE